MHEDVIKFIGHLCCRDNDIILLLLLIPVPHQSPKLIDVVLMVTHVKRNFIGRLNGTCDM